MGGWGSGFQGAAKPATTERLQLDVGKLAKGGALRPGTRATVNWGDCGSIGLRAEGSGVGLSYQLNGTPRADRIAVDWVPCRLGGTRPWFRCPDCGRRCRDLYSTPHGFTCRTCAGLNHPSTRADKKYQHLRRADQIRARLGWGAGILNPRGPRPKGMHRRTFARLLAELDRHEAAHWAVLQPWIARLQRRTAAL